MLFFAASASAQLNFDYTEGKFLIKGQITDIKTDGAVPYANIWIPNQKKGITTDGEGKFTMYVYPGDSLQFSSLGYITKTFPVSGIPPEQKYTLKIALVPDIYKFKTVTVYPFRNREEFARAFVKGEGVPQVVVLPGMEAPKYIHREKAKFYNPISGIYNAIKAKKRAADPNFKP
ncbi:MAG: carboxypeptidase-like regulatory domain-containing protein [Chitinophagales bacterium]